MTPDEYCQEKAAGSGSSVYYSFLFLSPPQRRAVTALYAFCREVNEVVDECHDAGVARLKLQWWREEIARTFEGSARHPVTQALQTAIREYGLSLEHFLDVIAGVEMALEHVVYPSFAELEPYCHRVAGVVGLMVAQIFGYRDSRTPRYAHDLGVAFQLTHILRDVRADAARGRVYLPQDEMARYGVAPADLTQPHMSERLRELLHSQAERARRYYQHAFEQLPEEDRHAQLGGLIMAQIYLALLDEIARDDYQVLAHRVSLTPLRKLWIAWNTARREKRRWRKYRRGVSSQAY